MSVAKKKRVMVQLGLELPPPKMTHGGARVGAGRKRSTNEQPHREREKFTKRCPVQVTLKMKPDIKNLRRRDVYRKIEACLRFVDQVPQMSSYPGSRATRRAVR